MATTTSKPAPDGQPLGCRTEDLLMIHAVMRNAFARAPGVVESASPGDTQRTQFVADHLDEAMTALHNHHAHEDNLYWDLIRQRAPEAGPVLDRMVAAHRDISDQLHALQTMVTAWRRDGQVRDALAAALRKLDHTLTMHLDDEETHILPLAARVLTQAEWDRAREVGIKEIPRNRLGLQAGYMLKCAPTEALRAEFWRQLPLPARVLYRLIARRQFEREWKALYGSNP